jgi:hypothetical protein
MASEDRIPNEETEISEQQATVLAQSDWQELDIFGEDELLGFLQICIEKRFHRFVQNEFQKLTGLSDSQYWLHADVGGSAGMIDNVKAPDYAYGKGVKVMGWSSHGANCGGFEGLPDEEIKEKLEETVRLKALRYREAKHYGLFATLRHSRPIVEYWVVGPLTP